MNEDEDEEKQKKEEMGTQMLHAECGSQDIVHLADLVQSPTSHGLPYLTGSPAGVDQVALAHLCHHRVCVLVLVLPDGLDGPCDHLGQTGESVPQDWESHPPGLR